MNKNRTLRYLAPNLITSFNILLGLMAVASAFNQDYELSAWLIVYATFLDRLDGFVARLVNGSSEFGVQMDSFSDFLNFGLAPPALIYCSISSSPILPFQDGFERYLLMASCVLWVFAAAFRLARYNVTEDAPTTLSIRIFFGVPTTVVGGLLATWYLALYKYAPTGNAFPMLGEEFGGPKLVPSLETPIWIWNYTPVVMLIGAYLMASSIRLPKGWPTPTLFRKLIYYVPIFAGIGMGLIQLFPEYMVWPPTVWISSLLVWGAVSTAMRNEQPPPVFPPSEPLPVPANARAEVGDDAAASDDDDASEADEAAQDE